MSFLKNVKARTLWIITLVVLLIAVGLVVSLMFVKSEYNTLMLVLIVISFVMLTILIQVASFKSFKFKPKEIPTIKKEYKVNSDLIAVLRKDKYKERTKSFGVSFLKISKPNAFKVTIINDIEIYYNNEEIDNSSYEKELDKCDRMIGLEIFLNFREEDLIKFKDYSLQAKNIYYTCLYFDEDRFVCPNYIEPDLNHKRNFDELFNELGLKELENEDEAKA